MTCIKDSGLDRSEIHDVLLVGGSTRIPAVQAKVKKFLEKILQRVNPDEVVAAGAATQGGVLLEM